MDIYGHISCIIIYIYMYLYIFLCEKFFTGAEVKMILHLYW